MVPSGQTTESLATKGVLPSAPATSREVANTLGCTPYGGDRSIVVVRGSGAFLETADGARLIDLANAFGTVLVGHGDEAIVDAIVAAVRSGVPAGSDLRGYRAVVDELASDLGRDVDVAFYKSGTAAVRAAVTACRVTSGRTAIASAGYHGHDPMWDAAPLLEPNADGVVHFYYVHDLLERILRERAAELAAVVIAPDYVHVSAEAVAGLFDLARSYGVPTVCDDVKYGYRMRMGMSLEGVEPDLVVYAKGIGNGWPVACVLGAADTMAALRPATSSLTFDAPTAAAVLATLSRLRELDAPAAVAREAGVFLAESRRRIAARRLPIELVGSGNAFQIVAERDVERDLLAHALAAGLVFEPEDQQLPSAAFTGAVVAEAVERFDRALELLASRRPELVGAEVSETARLDAAWAQMDGAPERGWSLDEAVSFLEPRVRAACAVT